MPFKILKNAAALETCRTEAEQTADAVNCDRIRKNAQAMAPDIERIDHIHVFVADRPAAEQWYGRVMGLERLASLELWAPGGGPLTLANASGTVHLALFERPAAKCRSTIALGTSAGGLLAWRRHLAAELGRPVEMVDHQVSWSVYFEDPDGNPFEVTTYEYEALAGR